ncbi:hypothetical protein ACSQ67_022686 [Phaseolus vulgaris]
MGAKKKTGGGNGNKENQDAATTVVLKLDFHCDGCASKIIRHLRSFQGVETVKAEDGVGKVTVTGKVDPVKLRDNLAEKMKKKVEIVSPQTKKEKEKEKEENKDTKANNKTQDKKNKDKEVVTTAVLKMALHCQGCLDRIGKTVLKTKGVQEMAIDKEKETVTVKGTMDVKALVENLTEKLKRKVEVVPPKKEKDGDKDKEGSGNKKKKGGGGGGGGGDTNEEGVEKIDYSRMEYVPQPSFGFGYGYGHGNIGGYSYVPVYPEQMQFHLHAPAPQIFSDENPNACSVM